MLESTMHCPRQRPRSIPLIALALLATGPSGACGDAGPPTEVWAGDGGDPRADAVEPAIGRCAQLGLPCPETCEGGAAVCLSEPIALIPSDALPIGISPQTSNNNLDVAWFSGRVFVAFRTAPSHFAGTETVLYVMSTADWSTWRMEEGGGSTASSGELVSKAHEVLALEHIA